MAAAPDVPGAGGRSNLLVRVLTAVVGIPVVLGLNYLGGWPFGIALALVAAVGIGEFCDLAGAAGYAIVLPIASAGVVVLCLLPALAGPHAAQWLGAVLVAVAFLAGCFLLAPGQFESPAFGRWALTVAGTAYVGVLLAHLALLRGARDGAWWVALVLVITWAYDTGAYFAGRAVGRHSFMRHVSPSKTVEGVVGGLVLAGAAGLLGIRFVGLSAPVALVFGLVTGVVAQAGDLIESMFKRKTGVKDSGSIIPGHGGLLDRIDSLLFTGAVGYYAAVLLGYAS